MSRSPVRISRGEFLDVVKGLSRDKKRERFDVAQSERAPDLQRLIEFWESGIKSLEAASSADDDFVAKANETMDVIYQYLLDGVDYYEKAKLEPLLEKFKLGGSFRVSVLSGIDDEADPERVRQSCMLMAEVSQYVRKLPDYGFEGMARRLYAFPHSYSDSEFACADEVRKLLQESLEASADFNKWREVLMLEAHNRVVKKYAEYSVSRQSTLRDNFFLQDCIIRSISFGDAYSSVDLIGEEARWKNYHGYAQNLNAEIRNLIAEIYQPKITRHQDDLISFILNNPSPQEFTEYCLTLGLPTPDLEELMVDTGIGYEKVWRDAASLRGGALKESFLKAVVVVDDLADERIDESDDEEEVKYSADALLHQSGRVICDDVRNPLIAKQIGVLVKAGLRALDGDFDKKYFNKNQQKLEAAVNALSLIGRKVDDSFFNGSFGLASNFHILNCICEIGLEGGEVLNPINFDEVFEGGLERLKELQGCEFDLRGSKIKPYADKLKSVIEGADRLRETLKRKGANAVAIIFMQAVRKGDVGLVRNMLENPDFFDLPTNLAALGLNPLFVAASENNVEMMQELLADRSRFNLQEIDRNGEKNIIYIAAENNAAEVLDYLLSNYSGEFAKDSALRDQEASICEAANNGGDESVAVLIRHRTNVNVKAPYSKYTPLSLAIRNGRDAAVKMLLACPDCNFDFDPTDDAWSYSPLAVATKNGNEFAVKELLRLGCVDSELKLYSDAKTHEIRQEILAYKLACDGVKYVFDIAKKQKGFADKFKGDHLQLYKKLIKDCPAYLLEALENLSKKEVSDFFRKNAAILVVEDAEVCVKMLISVAVTKSIVNDARKAKGDTGKVAKKDVATISTVSEILTHSIDAFVERHGLENLTKERVFCLTRMVVKNLERSEVVWPFKYFSGQKFYPVNEASLLRDVNSALPIGELTKPVAPKLTVARRVGFIPVFIESHPMYSIAVRKFSGSAEEVFDQAVKAGIVEVLPAHGGEVESYVEIKLNYRPGKEITFLAHPYNKDGVTKYFILGTKDKRRNRELAATVNKKHWDIQLHSFEDIGECAPNFARSYFSVSILNGSPLFRRDRFTFFFAVDVDPKDVHYATRDDMWSVNHNEHADLAPIHLYRLHKISGGVASDKEDLYGWAKDGETTKELAKRGKSVPNVSGYGFKYSGKKCTDPYDVLDNPLRFKFNEALVTFHGNRNPVKIILPLRMYGSFLPKTIERAEALADFFRQTGNEVQIVECDERRKKFHTKSFLSPTHRLKALRKALKNILTGFDSAILDLDELPISFNRARLKRMVNESFDLVVEKYGGVNLSLFSLLTKEDLGEFFGERVVNLKAKGASFSQAECNDFVFEAGGYALAKYCINSLEKGALGKEENFAALSSERKKAMIMGYVKVFGTRINNGPRNKSLRATNPMDVDFLNEFILQRVKAGDFSVPKLEDMSDVFDVVFKPVYLDNPNVGATSSLATESEDKERKSSSDVAFSSHTSPAPASSLVTTRRAFKATGNLKSISESDEGSSYDTSRPLQAADGKDCDVAGPIAEGERKMEGDDSSCGYEGDFVPTSGSGMIKITPRTIMVRPKESEIRTDELARAASSTRKERNVEIDQVAQAVGLAAAVPNSQKVAGISAAKASKAAVKIDGVKK